MREILKKIRKNLSDKLNLFDTESFYDKHAIDYEKKRLYKGMLFNDFIEAPALFDEIKKFKKIPKKILDIGCGVGYYSKNLSYNADEIFALDISLNMIEIAKKNCKKFINIEQFNKINFIHSSFENYKIDNKNYFDLVLATFMLSYFENLDIFFEKVKTTISSDGKLITSMLHPIRLFSEKEKNGYYLTDYFKQGYYESDFIDKEETLKLKKWTLQEITNSAFKHGFLIEKLVEPKPIRDIPEELKNDAEFYYNNPSILIIIFRRK